ncbi:MAG: hypothetical protein Q9166_004475 [cf. Caloplaca sp. 2 TL-2023]
MTENVPPSTTADNTTRGIPYYEKLKRDLRETLQKKRLLDKNMATLEDQIYRFEASYLEETSSAGNIIKGFDNYVKGSALSGSELSPTSSTQSTPNAPTPTSGNPQQASTRAGDHPTPTSATSLKAGHKKNKKGNEREDEESEGKQPKRLKITYARGGVGGD